MSTKTTNPATKSAAQTEQVEPAEAKKGNGRPRYKKSPFHGVLDRMMTQRDKRVKLGLMKPEEDMVELIDLPNGETVGVTVRRLQA